MSSNKKQKAFWTGPAGKVWVEGKNEKDNMLKPLGNALLKTIIFKNGMNVLEIGCGTGYIMNEISNAIGINGNVTGVDISKTMINEAEKYLRINEVNNAICKVLDAENEDLGFSEFDLICSRFGVMFFKDPFKAFDNMHKALKKDAFIHFICWQDHKLNPWNSLPLRIVKKYIDLPVLEEKTPSPFAFSNKDYIKEILVNSMYENIDILDHEEDIELYKGYNLQEAVNEFLAKTPVFTEQFYQLSDNKKQELINDLVSALKDYYNGNALKFSSKTWIVSAQKVN